MEAHIRHAVPADLSRINAIYNSHIVEGHMSFDFEPWSSEQRNAWFERYAETGRYQVLVIAADAEVFGFAASGPYRDKEGYNTSVETTIVLDKRYLGRGFGTSLLRRLIEQLAAEDVHRAYALIALPNQRSVALHERFGYREVGVLDEVGRKQGSYHSVLMMERSF